MSMRNPLYLDLELVRNVADYYGVSYVVEALVTERGKSSTQGGGKVSVMGTQLGLEHTEGSEVESTYQIAATPLRIMNDVIDAVFEAGDIHQDLATENDGKPTLRKGAIVEIEGSLILSAASEAGSIMGRILPIMASSGGTMTEAAKAEILASMMGNNEMENQRLYKFESDWEQNIVVPVEATYLFRGNSYDDIEKDVTVFGSVQRVVADGKSVDLDQWLLPNTDRAVRRMMKRQGIEGLLEGLQQIAEINIADAQALHGPALEIRPIAIY